MIGRERERHISITRMIAEIYFGKSEAPDVSPVFSIILDLSGAHVEPRSFVAIELGWVGSGVSSDKTPSRCASEFPTCVDDYSSFGG